ncbi:uncharacterized protein RJT20DRAFT_135509 [Scheffersomyces xylosifermentans]|uniref:uncharacterized protein n=1 Tax=Scheffersomyces xylosifermentans TaxID=1304137 RepID=UPI00315CD716
MVVRSVLRTVISKVPYSNHMPDIVTNLISEENNNKETRTHSLERNRVGSSKDEYQARSLSPKEKIHHKLINNRMREVPALNNALNRQLNKVDELDEIEYEQSTLASKEEGLVNYLNYCDTCDTIPINTKLGINKLSDNKVVTSSHSRRESVNNTTNSIFEDAGSGLPVNENTLIESSNNSVVMEPWTLRQPSRQQAFPSNEDRNLRTQEYLNEQNNKFDTLISNNLNIVLKEYERPDELDLSNFGLIRFLYKNTTDSIVSRIPFGNTIRKKITGKNTNSTDKPTATTQKIVNPPQTVPMTDIYIASSTPNSNLEPPFTPDNQYDNVASVELFIDSLDHETKMTLLAQLKLDLQEEHLQEEQPARSAPNDDNKNNQTVISASAIDKFQEFLIIWIKLFITSLKLMIPLTKYIYHKFKNNEFYILNNKNMNNIFDTMLRSMNYLEKKLNNNEEMIDKIYRQEGSHDNAYNENFDNIYKEISENVSNYFNEQIMNAIGGGEHDKSLKGMTVQYVLSRYLPGHNQKNKNDFSDPKYNIYFSPAHNQQGISGSTATITSRPNSSPASLQSSDSYTSERQSSEENLEDLSILRIAQQFVDEFGP